MPKYRVHIRQTIIEGDDVVVEAGSEDEAIDKAEEIRANGFPDGGCLEFSEIIDCVAVDYRVEKLSTP